MIRRIFEKYKISFLIRLAFFHKDPDMPIASRILFVLPALIGLLAGFVFPAPATSAGSKWQITSIRVCKDYRGTVIPHVQAIGNYPVYSFFIPRPVWTVNGTIVDAQPVYDRGKLVSFKLISCSHLLKSGVRNTIKFSLPDQNASKTFRYDHTKAPPGDCYEFF
ncbi:hypothetical protein ACFL2Q_04080 [Thermodesulfobacteriota bacterium]